MSRVVRLGLDVCLLGAIEGQQIYGVFGKRCVLWAYLRGWLAQWYDLRTLLVSCRFMGLGLSISSLFVVARCGSWRAYPRYAYFSSTVLEYA